MSKAIVRDVLQRAPVKPRLLSVEQTAIMLGVGTSTVYNLIAAKKLAAIKIGDRTLIKPATVTKFIRTRPKAKATPRRASRERRLG
jgi:excisionase family DNA binding protein